MNAKWQIPPDATGARPLPADPGQAYIFDRHPTELDHINRHEKQLKILTERFDLLTMQANANWHSLCQQFAKALADRVGDRQKIEALEREIRTLRGNRYENKQIDEVIRAVNDASGQRHSFLVSRLNEIERDILKKAVENHQLANEFDKRVTNLEERTAPKPPEKPYAQMCNFFGGRSNGHSEIIPDETYMASRWHGDASDQYDYYTRSLHEFDAFNFSGHDAHEAQAEARISQNKWSNKT